MKNIDIVKSICKELGSLESLITLFAEGIKKTIQWYLDNKEWWQEIVSGEYRNYYRRMYEGRK